MGFENLPLDDYAVNLAHQESHRMSADEAENHVRIMSNLINYADYLAAILRLYEAYEKNK
ncbi:MAG: hypothetical protein JWN70_2994 [Planctomycetaceae bacterium]|nr:hypothetical protein [Planctomycetaceae bacterium]